MNSKDRVLSVLNGRKPDRPPVSFWHHFGPDEFRGQSAVDAHVRHFEMYRLDFLKIMHDTGYPRPKETLESAADLSELRVWQGNEGPFAEQLELIRGIRARLGSDALCCTTIFNSWTTLRGLAAPPSEHHGPPVIGGDGVDPRDATTRRWIEQDRPALDAALETIAQSLANFSANCIEAGADGIFLSCRDDWVDGVGGATGAYDRLVTARDRKILDSAKSGSFNVLHVCGRALNFQRFAAYPAHVINWADRQCGPRIRDVIGNVKPAVCCGVDNLTTMPDGSPKQCEVEVRDALEQAGERPILVAPGCTYDPSSVPKANLNAIRESVEK
jgi:uroporphyrinogen decarboxylase